MLLEPAQDSGARIARVYPSSPAAHAGLRRGQVILGIAGEKTATPSEAIAAINKHEPGEKITVRVRRSGQAKDLELTLGTQEPHQTSDWTLTRIPAHHMMLEHQRSIARQHQRIETICQRLAEEVRRLREEVQRLREEASGERPTKKNRRSTRPRVAATSRFTGTGPIDLPSHLGTQGPRWWPGAGRSEKQIQGAFG